MLIIGLVCSALNATAEVKTLYKYSGGHGPIIKIKEGEVGIMRFSYGTLNYKDTRKKRGF